MIFFNKNAIKNKIQHYKQHFIELLKQKEKLDEDRKVDEASLESMPASDPPGHNSKERKKKIYH